jgi:hypothetical protein
MAKAEREIADEMRRWRAIGFVISMSPRHRMRDSDPGVALWWRMPRPANRPGPEDLRVLACDTWPWPEDNLHAIGLTLRGLRAFERYGTYTREQAIEGARAFLPAPDESQREAAWWELIGVERDWPLAAIEAVWKTKLEKVHPDRGGQPGEAAVLNAAMDAARKEKAP